MKAHGCSLVLVMCVLDISEQQGAGGKGRKGWSTTVCGVPAAFVKRTRGLKRAGPSNKSTHK
jgi:hypothetical protein